MLRTDGVLRSNGVMNSRNAKNNWNVSFSECVPCCSLVRRLLSMVVVLAFVVVLTSEFANDRTAELLIN